MLSFSKSYLGDTEVKTEPTSDSLRDSGTSWKPKWVVRGVVEGPAEASAEEKESAVEAAGGVPAVGERAWLLASRANATGAASSLPPSARVVDARDMMVVTMANSKSS